MSQKQQERRDEILAKASNPDSNADELGNAIRWVFLPLASLWVGYIGYIFTSNALAGVVEPWQASLLAIALPCFVQVLKVYGAVKVLRSFHFKWYDRSAQDFWFWVVCGGIVLIMFVWSLKISVFDIKDTSKDVYIAQNADTLTALITAATAPIDQQIAELNHSNQQAGGMKTKRGKVAWSGQSIMMANAATLSSLNEQRAGIVAQVTADYQSGKARLEKGAGQRANFFQRFGGFGEALEILFLILLGLLEAANRNSNLERLEAKQAADPLAQFRQNGSHHRPVQFRWDGYGQPRGETVPQSPQTVAQENDGGVMGCDAVLRNMREKVQRDIPNFHRRDANKATVSGRINRALDEALRIMSQEGFKPSRRVGIETYDYVVGALKTLDEIGWPYERKNEIIRQLISSLPQQTATA